MPLNAIPRLSAKPPRLLGVPPAKLERERATGCQRPSAHQIGAPAPESVSAPRESVFQAKLHGQNLNEAEKFDVGDARQQGRASTLAAQPPAHSAHGTQVLAVQAADALPPDRLGRQVALALAEDDASMRLAMPGGQADGGVTLGIQANNLGTHPAP